MLRVRQPAIKSAVVAKAYYCRRSNFLGNGEVMYPRNAASPPRISVGAVVQISDGAVQTAGVSIVVRPEGGAETAGAGTLSYGATSGIVYYTPTQAETDYVAFVVVAYKTGCIPAEKAVITSASSTAGHAGTDQSKIVNPTAVVNLTGTSIKNATDNASQTSVDGKPTLVQIEASSVLAKEATVNTRASQTSVNGIPTNPLLTTDSRLNNLDFAISTVNNNILNLNNLSAKMNLFGSPLLEIPESGSTVYAFTLVVKDDEDKLVNLDASPTVTAANAAGTNRSGNLSAVSNPSTGRYTFTYTVANTHASESLRIAVSGTVSAEARYVEWIGAVVNYDSLTVLQSVQTTVNAIDTRLPAAPAAVGDIPTANQNRDAVMNAMPNGGWVNGSFGDRWLIGTNDNREVQVTGSNHVSADVHAFQAGVIDAAAIAAGALNGKGDWLTTLGANAPANWINAAAIATDAIDADAIAASAVNKITVNLFKYGDIQLWTSPANQIQVTITKV